MCGMMCVLRCCLDCCLRACKACGVRYACVVWGMCMTVCVICSYCLYTWYSVCVVWGILRVLHALVYVVCAWDVVCVRTHMQKCRRR